MNIQYKNYAITHNGLNYVVNKVSAISGERAKEENLCKVALYPLKYYSTLKVALKSIRDMVITDGIKECDDLDAAISKIEMLDDEFYDYLRAI